MGLRRPITITRETLLFVAACIVGVVCCVLGISVLFKERYARTFEELTLKNCRVGNYITSDIESYLVSIDDEWGNGMESGVSRILISGIRIYDFYTVPIGDGHYISIMVFRQKTKDALAQYEHGQSGEEPILFEGEIIKATMELNAEWYENVPELSGGLNDMVIDNYIVKEIDFAGKRRILYVGIVFLAVAALLFYHIKKENEKNVY